MVPITGKLLCESPNEIGIAHSISFSEDIFLKEFQEMLLVGLPSRNTEYNNKFILLVRAPMIKSVPDSALTKLFFVC